MPVLAIALALVCSTAWAQPQSRRTVLTVHWGSEDFPTNPAQDAGIREALRSGPDAAIDYYAEYLESERFPEEEASLALRDYIQRKYRGRRIDLVVAVTDVSLQFVLRFRQDLFPDAPIVYRGVASVDDTVRNAGAGLTGLSLGRGLDETLALALKLHPSTERVFVVAQAPSVRIQDSMRRAFEAVAPRVAITDVTEDSLPRMLAAIKAVPPRSVVLYVRYSQKEPGHLLFPSEVARLVAEASPVPVYGISDSYLGSGVVGAVYQTRAIGFRMGEMARQILDGTRPQDIPIEPGVLVPTFDWRQLQRWRIDERDLPAGSAVLFQEPSAWDRYRWYILGAAALVAIQAVLMAALVLQRSRRRQTESRTSALLRAMPDLMFLQTVDGVYLDYHAPDPRQLLLLPEQFLGRNMRDVLPPALLSAIEPAFARTADATEPVLFEYDIDLPQGTLRYEARLVRSNNDQILTLVRDITQQKQAETALRDSAQRYALASAAGAVGVWDWNFETNEIYVDPTLKSILGFEDAEISNRAEDWGGRVHLQDLAAVTAQTQACIDGRVKEYEVEHRMTHKDGSVRWFLSRGSLLRRPDGTAHRMVGTKVDITERKNAEEAMREHEAVLQASHREIRDLAGRLIASQELERARIARDLHDDLSQQLAGLSIALSGLKRRLAAFPGAGEAQSDVASLQQRTVALAENVRHLSHDLHPSVLAHAGLVAALGAHCAELQRRQTVVVTFSADGDFESISRDAALCLYRVAQEALRNVVTHAGARHAEVRLIHTGDHAELTIADDGRGFDIVKAGKNVKSLGLVSINERVRLAGGTVSIVTELQKGTRVRVQVPTERVTTNAAAGVPGPYATSA